MGHKENNENTTSKLIEPMFEPTFPRPTKLSDPFGDFFDRAPLDAIVSKAPGELDWRDYRDIFQCGMPAGEIPESGYFLPWAFGYLRDLPCDANEYLLSLIHWISENASILNDANHTFDQIQVALNECLLYWTADFTVTHLNEDACRARGWGLAYDDLVTNSFIVTELLDALCKEKAHANIAIEFVSTLASKSATPIQSAWFLELVNEFNCGHFRDWKRHRHRKTLTPLKDESLWKQHAAVVIERIAPITESPTNWDDTLFFLQ